MRWASGNSSGREEGIQSVSGSTVSKTVTENRHEAGLALKEKKKIKHLTLTLAHAAKINKKYLTCIKRMCSRTPSHAHTDIHKMPHL